MDFIVQYLLPLFYITLLAWLLQRNKNFKQNGFTALFIIIFFIAKCAAGIVYDYISIKYIPKGGDIPLFYGDGLQLYKTFMQSPAEALQQVRHMFSFQDVDLLNSHSSFIQRVFEGIKFIYFILDFFSFGNLYTDTILFNGFAVFAFLHCGVFLKKYFRSAVPFMLIFLMPSAFFYTSAIFKEGLVFILICFMLPVTYKICQSPTLKRFFIFLALFSLMFFFKFLIAVTFLLALVLWWLLLKFQHKKKTVVMAFLFFLVAVFFLSGQIAPQFDMPQNIINRQHEFLELDAHSKIAVPHLQPTFQSFLFSLPAALNNVLFKPLPGEGGKLLYLFFFLELCIFWGAIFFLWAKNNRRFKVRGLPPLVACLFIFGIINLLIIGYTISNIGAITRYRSIFLPFISLFFWFVFDGNRILPLVHDNLEER